MEISYPSYVRSDCYSVRTKEDLNGHTYLEGENLFSALRRLFLYQFESLNGNHPPSFFVICSTRYWKSTKSWKRTKSHTVRRTGTKNIATRGTDRNVSNQASDNDLERLLDCFSFFFFNYLYEVRPRIIFFLEIAGQDPQRVLLLRVSRNLIIKTKIWKLDSWNSKLNPRNTNLELNLLDSRKASFERFCSFL